MSHFFLLILYQILSAEPKSYVEHYRENYLIRNDSLLNNVEKSVFVGSESARESYGTIVIPFDDSRQKVRVVYARTISPKGDTIYVTPNAINIVASELVNSYPFLSNRKELHISFISIQPGSKLEYLVEIEESPFTFLDGLCYFQEELEVKSREINFTLPKGLIFNFKLYERGNLSIREEICDSSNYVIYKFYSSEIPALPEVVTWRNHVPLYLASSVLVFSTFPSWDSLMNHLKHFYLGRSDIKKQEQDLRRIVKLADLIDSPEYEPFTIQGYVPLNFDRALNSTKMTFPEEVYRIISSNSGLSPAFVLRYGFSIAEAPPSLALIQTVILFDGKKFINPFRGNKKPLVTDYSGYNALVLYDTSGYEERTIEVAHKNVCKITLDVKGRKAFLQVEKGKFSYDYDSEEDENNRVEEKFLETYNRILNIFGNVKKTNIKVKGENDPVSPVQISGKVCYSDLGYKLSNFLIIELPPFNLPNLSQQQRGFFISRDEDVKNIVSLIISMPKGYKVSLLPESFEIKTEDFELVFDAIQKENDIFVTYSLFFKKRYYTRDEVTKMNKAFADKGLLGRKWALIFEHVVEN